MTDDDHCFSCIFQLFHYILKLGTDLKVHAQRGLVEDHYFSVR